MGLSAYGKPKYFEKLKNIINIKNTFELNLNYFHIIIIFQIMYQQMET